MPPAPHAARRPLRIHRCETICLAVFLVFLLSGCATWPRPVRSPHADGSQPSGRCAAFFAALDRHTVEDGALDAGEARVPEHPYLRTNRFLASFRDEAADDRAFSAWVDRMLDLDRSARSHEIANLSDAAVREMESSGRRQDLHRRVFACGDLLRELDFARGPQREKLRETSSVPDEYVDLRRVLGLYPLTRLGVSFGVDRWHESARATFTTDPPGDWAPVARYVPAGEPEPGRAADIVRLAPRDALGVPSYTPGDRSVLLGTHAPVWLVQTRSDDDRIGRPEWTEDGRVGVDTRRPEAYTLVTFTRFGPSVLTQLSYVVWFPSRPKTGPLDIYGGRLDGLHFRVTLDPDGAPLLYETIHNCGCYYKAYPTDGLRRRGSIDLAEPPLILAAPEAVFPRRRLVLALEAGTHYVHHFYPAAEEALPGDAPYPLRDYAELQGLPAPDGRRRSMFDRYGLVPGSERLERFLLWPMGVPSPGAMRQAGKHAVAFVGKRHFDDPFYLEKMFLPPDRAEGPSSGPPADGR